MSINKIGSDLVRSLISDKKVGSREKGSDGEIAEEQPRAPRQDRVELSAEGLARVAELEARQETQSLDAARTDEIRARIDGKFYDDPSVAEAVAHRLHGSGDLA
ncbi:MAG: hypothetical protein RJQ04_21985 [Longimicrobiales bacterium]